MSISSAGYLIKEGFKNIANNRIMSLASVIVLASCLIITGAASLISVNMSNIISRIGDDNEITVYLMPDYSDLDSVKLGPELGKIKNIDSYKYITREKVLEQYKKNLGDSIYESMQGSNNPFGNEYKVKLKDLSQYKKTVKQIKKLSGVDTVSDRTDVAAKLTSLNYFVTIAGSWVVLILAVVTLFIISNTIRMTMYSRRFEIRIMKSVGATNTFVRIPFIIEAVIIGLISAAAASAVLIAAYTPVKDAAAGIIGLIGDSALPVDKIWLPVAVVMAAAGILIGLIGSFISITRYLNREGGASLGK